MAPNPQMAELKASNEVRRVLQRIRLATPETLEQLEGELFDSMEANLDGLGSLHERIQAEVDKTLDLARQRVAATLERREQEALAAERPRALMDEVKEAMQRVKGLTDELREAIGADKPDSEVSLDEADNILSLAESHQTDLSEFSQLCLTSAAEIKAVPALPLDMRKEWMGMASQILQAKTKGQLAVASAKAAVTKAREGVRRQLLEEKKEDVRRILEERTAAVAAVERHILAAESLVEPFIRGRRREEAEYNSLAAQADEAMATAKDAVANARQDIQDDRVAQDVVQTLDDDAKLKKQLEDFIASERKRPHMRLGQFERRVNRISNIVGRFRKDVQRERNAGLFEELKTDLLEKVKSLGENPSTPSVDSADTSVKAAEREVEPCAKHRTMSLAEMTQRGAQAAEALAAAKGAIEEAKQEMCPIDAGLDEELQKRLRSAAAPFLKRPMVRVGQLERRIARVSNLLTAFQLETTKKAESQHGPIRAKALRVLRHHMGAQEVGPEDVFLRMGEPVDKSSFLAFFEGVDRHVPKPGSKADEGATEAVELPEDGLGALFDSLVPNGDGLLKQEAFLQWVCPVMHVVKPTSLTTDHSLASARMIRHLKPGELLDALEGPVKEDKAGLLRVRVRAHSDDKVGWATLAGNAGTVFLKDGKP